MKTAFVVLLCFAWIPSSLAYGGEQKQPRSDYNIVGGAAHLVTVHLSFVEAMDPKFVVTVTNVSGSDQTLMAEPRRFHGVFRSPPKGKSVLELYVERYAQMKGTSLWVDPQHNLEQGESMAWEVPISSLVKFPGLDPVSMKDLSGLTFAAEFERLGMVPKTKTTFTDRNAAQTSNEITIP